MIVNFLLLSIIVTSVSASSDCNQPPEDYTPGQCCEYGWRNIANITYPDLFNPGHTKTFGKISCLQWVFPIHLFFTFSIVILGIIAMTLRIPALSKWVWLHPWLGRLTFLSLFGAMLSSLLIHNEGLPTGVIVNFVIALVCISIAWFAIVIEKQRLHKIAVRSCVDEQAYDRAVKNVWATKTLRQKFLSLYTLHGSLMFTAWFQFFGRMFYLIFLGSSYGHGYLSGGYSFTCYTYPVYKRDVSNYIFCDDKQSNDLWASCTGKGFCPLLENSSSSMPWDSKKDGGLGIATWVFLLVIVPLFLVLLVFTYCVRSGRRANAETNVVGQRTRRRAD